MLSFLVVPSQFLDGFLFLLMLGPLSVIWGRNPAQNSFGSLGALFLFGLVCRAPMTCIWLGVFGANTLLLHLLYKRYAMQESGVSLFQPRPRPLLRKEVLRGVYGVIGIAPLWMLYPIGAQQIIRVTPVSYLKRTFLFNDGNDFSYMLCVFFIFFILLLLGIWINLQKKQD